MEGELYTRTKEAVCNAFTNLLRRSHFGHWIEPEAFSQSLSSRYDALYKDGALDLGPVWDSLSVGSNPQELSILFLKFVQEARRLGVTVRLPAIIETLGADRRAYSPQSNPDPGDASSWPPNGPWAGARGGAVYTSRQDVGRNAFPAPDEIQTEQYPSSFRVSDDDHLQSFTAWPDSAGTGTGPYESAEVTGGHDLPMVDDFAVIPVSDLAPWEESESDAPAEAVPFVAYPHSHASTSSAYGGISQAGGLADFSLDEGANTLATPLPLYEGSTEEPVTEHSVNRASLGDSPPDPVPIRLSTGDLKPIIPEDVKRAVVNAVVQSVKGSPAGWRINSQRLRSAIEGSFDKLCDGVRFDFIPVLEALLREDGVKESDAFIAALRLIEQLKPLNMTMDEPPTTLSEDVCARLRLEARSLDVNEVQAPSEMPPRPGAVGEKPIRLGDLLVNYQLISEAQLQQALRAQSVLGGRLGTNLIELGFIEERALAHFLSVQLNLPAIGPEELRSISPDALACLPADIIKKHKVIPISMEHRKLRLAMTDPTDLKLIDEVSFRTGHRVQPVVAPEVLIDEALERYFGVKREARRRIVSFPSEENGGEEFQVVQASRKFGSQGTVEQGDSGSIIIEERGHFFSTERNDFSHEQPVLDNLPQDLLRATDASDVFRILLKYVGREFERTAIFTLNGSVVSGAEQLGCAISSEEFRKVSFPIQDSQVFRILCTERRTHIGPLPMSGKDSWIIGLLGVPPGGDVVSTPMLEGHRTVGFMIASGSRRGEVFDGVSLCDRFSEKVNLALQMLSLKKQLLAT